MSFSAAFAIFVKFFFLLTPPFVMSVFLALTKSRTPSEKTQLAWRITVALIVLSAVLLLCGRWIFEVFGITLDAFRIGTGALLFLTSVSLVQGESMTLSKTADINSLAVVPLAIPITLGPASVGALIVIGGEVSGFVALAIAFGAITAATVATGLLLAGSAYIEKLIGANGLTVMSKLTGLILAALSCQMIFTGVTSMLKAAFGNC